MLMARVGILGGSFNPPHNGHVQLASTAADRLGLDRVVLVPAGVAPHKTIESDPGADVRLELCGIAAERLDRVEVSDIEVGRPGPSWTVETLRALKSADPDGEFVLLLGQDMAMSLTSWREPEAIVKLAKVAWVARGEQSEAEMKRAEQQVSDQVRGLGGDEPVCLVMPPVDVSSTQIRQCVAAGEPIADLVPAGVEWVIAERGLYRAGGANEN